MINNEQLIQVDILSKMTPGIDDQLVTKGYALAGIHPEIYDLFEQITRISDTFSKQELLFDIQNYITASEE